MEDEHQKHHEIVNSRENTRDLLLDGTNSVIVRTDESTETYQSWIMLFLVCLAITVTYGMTTTVGVFHVIFLEEFQKSNAVTSWIGSINTGSAMLGGMVCGLLANHFSCRLLIMVGVFMCTGGLALSSLATSVEFLYISFGLITGLGVGFVYMGSCTCMSQWFDRHLALACGIATSATGLSTSIYPHLINYLKDIYGWRGSFLILGAIDFQFLVGACFQKPHPSKTKILSKTKANCQNLLRLDLLRNKDFDMYLLNHAIIFFGVSIIYVHLESFGNTKYANISQWLIPVFGIANCVGRAVFGLVGNIPRIDAATIIVIFISISGVAIMCLPVVHAGAGAGASIIGLISIYGLFSGVIGYAAIVICSKYFDKDTFPAAYGYILLSVSVGLLTGAPVAGLIYDLTKDYSYSMYLGGAAHILSTIPLLPQIFTSSRKMRAMDLEYRINMEKN